MQGSGGEVEAGALYASGANASFGRYTGIDHGGVYADVASSGAVRSADGTYANYDLQRLGLPSRDGALQIGREGLFDLRVSYDGEPARLHDDAMSPYQIHGSTLSLPANWLAAGSTAGMSSLEAGLSPYKIEYDRRTLALLGRYFASSAWTFFGEFRHEEKSGTGLTSASFLTNAVQLPEPINYVTDSLEAGAAWAGRRASLRVSYTGSWFEDNSDTLTFSNPYLPIVPGSTNGRLALPPGNSLQQFSATGNVRLPWWSTTLSFQGSLGRLSQNAAFLPISTLPGSASEPAESLDGEVDVSHFGLGLAARPLSKLSVRGAASYDGRDDRTRPLAVTYVVTDTFPGGTVTTPRFGEDRTRLDGGADYQLASFARLGVGGEFQQIEYAPGQVLTHSKDAESWGRATLGPLKGVNFTLKVGNGLRKTSAFDSTALPPGETVSLLAYNYAPRDRVFSSFTTSWEASATLTWALEASLSKDDYRSAALGLLGAHDRRASTTLTWTPSAALSVYLDGGYQRLYTLQRGANGAIASLWLTADTEDFWNASVGGRWQLREHWMLSVEALHAPSTEATDSLVGGLPQSFPQNWTKLDSVHLDLSYQWTRAVSVRLRYVHETYDSSDWALEGVGPATLPNLLAVGIQPYRDSVNLIGLTARYRFGADRQSVQP
jgi:MtrB/PioB family decaheme-associated outer membrane protein